MEAQVEGCEEGAQVTNVLLMQSWLHNHVTDSCDDLDIVTDRRVDSITACVLR